jgi:NADPH2:quinone reductase
MKSMLLNSFNEKLRMADLPKPTCNAKEVLIRVLTTSLNFADILMTKGKYQEKYDLPFSPGMEVCGIITLIGEDSSSFKIGQRVVAYVGFGGLSEFITVSENLCFSVPDDISDEKAASLLIAYGSTELALNYKAKLKSDETLLVLGAAGGVGLSAVQIGKAMGANVVAVAKGKEKCKLTQLMGANLTFDSESVNLKRDLKTLDKIDVIYDPVGGDQFQVALAAAKPETRILPIGFASGEVPQIPANIVMVKNITIIGFYIGIYRTLNPNILRDCFQRLLEMWSQNIINPHISNVFSLEEANLALDIIEKRKSTGKVIVRVGT